MLDSLIGLGLYRTRIRLKKWYFLPLGGSRSCKCVAAASKSIWRETAIVPRPEPCSDVKLDDFGRWPMRCCKRQRFKRNGFKQLSGVVCSNFQLSCYSMLYMQEHLVPHRTLVVVHCVVVKCCMNTVTVNGIHAYFVVLGLSLYVVSSV